MNAASTDASQTMTVAAIHVPTPRIERPSVRSVVTISESERRDAARRRRAPGRAPDGTTLKRNGCSSAKTTVKTATATTKPVTFKAHAVEHRGRDDQADRVGGERDEHPDEEPDHGDSQVKTTESAERSTGPWYTASTFVPSGSSTNAA